MLHLTLKIHVSGHIIGKCDEQSWIKPSPINAPSKTTLILKMIMFTVRNADMISKMIVHHCIKRFLFVVSV